MEKRIHNIKQLVEEIESFGLIEWGRAKGYIKLNDKQWEHIKALCSDLP